jgi:BirA family biotin operon repressor/biotin-[acetyl-CoA-carboxylase] ligase
MKPVGPDLSRAPELLAGRGSALGRSIHLLGLTTSTNDEAKRGAQAGASHGATWVAEEQSAGRGRQGRTWLAAPGENLLFSVLLRLECPPARLPLVSLVAGLAVRDAVARAAPGAVVRVKWPNDVVAGEDAASKVAGVLVEAITAGSRVQAAVVGVGINVHTRHFPDELARRATSVALLGAGGSAPPDRAEILADVLAGLDHDLEPVLHRGLGLVRARLDAADALRGRIVRHTSVPGGDGTSAALPQRGQHQEEGVAEGIDNEGRLMVRLASAALVRYSAGEVHLGGCVRERR